MTATLAEKIERRDKLRRLAYLRQFQWICDRPDCDGLPHGTYPAKHARTKQRPPAGDWSVWLIQTGRGWGKTRTGAEWVARSALGQPGSRWAVVAPTLGDARDTCIEGDSGLLSVLPPDRVANWNRSMVELDFTNGSHVKCFSAEQPDRLRGPQHHGAWCDELAAWEYADTWDQLQFGLRLGVHPRVVVTTTPKPVAVVREILDRPDVVVTRGATTENAANLAPSALAALQRRYGGTRIGRQELEGELLEDFDGALWTRAMLEEHRVETAPELRRVVVAIDPAVTSGAEADDTGIVVAGVGYDGHGYVLADRTCHLSPEGWASHAIGVYDEFSGDRIVAEITHGFDLVESVIRAVDRTVPLTKVHASHGKRIRAEPVAALYEQGRVHHVKRNAKGELEDFKALEEGVDRRPGMVSWTPDVRESPDRIDALVWALTDLMLGEERSRMRYRGAA